MYQNLLELEVNPEVNTLAGARRGGHKNDGLRKGLTAGSPSEVNFGRGKNKSLKVCDTFNTVTHHKRMYSQPPRSKRSNKSS